MAASVILQTTKIGGLARSVLCQLRAVLNYRTNMSDAKKAKIIGTPGDTVEHSQERMIWVDLEMTGLDVQTDRIIEIACIVTTGDLDVVAEGPDIVIHESKEVMDGMNEWCIRQHWQSGLTQSVLASEVSVGGAEKEILTFLKQHTEAGLAPLAGNSVYTDKLFLQRYMPTLAQHLHYRIVDVSTVKELCRRWYPNDYQNAPEKAGSHRALDDIRESIKELQFYRQAIFKTNGAKPS